MDEVPERFNPFPGLRPFTEDEDYLFFGREAQSTELLRRLRQTRFLAVVGTSGSGKSSLVLAGVLPALHGGVMTRAGSRWRVALLRPGNNPIGALALALSQPHVLGTTGTNEDDLQSIPQTVIIETTLRRSALGLVEVVQQARRPAGENLLVVVDQFEELFRFKATAAGEQSSDDAAAFVKLLLEASRALTLPIYIMLTMRSDFLGDCAQFRDLPEAINDGQFLIPRMTRDQRRQAIEGPVAVGGATMTPRLVQRLLNDVGDNPDQLPILQHALMRTWENWRANVAPALDLPHYDAIGGMAEALSQHADEVFGALPDDRSRTVAEKIFKALTDTSADHRGLRRPTRLEDLCAVTSATGADVVTVIEAFRQPGSSFLVPPVGTPLRADAVIDISHESLMRVWKKLKVWAEEEAQSSRLYRRLAETAGLREEGKAGLWRDPDLQVALDWRAKEQPNEAWAKRYHAGFTQAMNFLEASVTRRDEEVRDQEVQRQLALEQAQALAEEQRRRAEEQTRAAKRLRRALWSTVTAAVCVALLAAFSFYLFVNMRRARDASVAASQVVDAQRRAATSRQLASQATNEVHEDRFGRALLLALEAFRVAPTADARASLLTGLEYSPQLIAFLRDPGGPPVKVAFSPDGRIFASANPSGVSVWDVEGQALLFQLPVMRSGDEPSGIAFRPDGKMLATSRGSEITLWELDGGRSSRPLNAAYPVSAIAFSPDNQILAGALRGDLITLWDATTGAHRADLRVTARHYLTSIAFNKGGEGLVVGYEDGSLAFWDVQTRSRTNLVDSHTFGPISALAFHPSEEQLVLGTRSGHVVICDSAGKPIASLDGHADIETLALSPDGKLLAVGDSSERNPLTLWDLPNRKRAMPLAGHLGKVSGVAFGPDGRHLASAGAEAELILWDLGNSQRLARRLTSSDVRVNKMVVSPDGSTVAVATQNRESNASEVLVWSLLDRDTAITHIPVPREQLNAMAFTVDSKMLVTLGCSARDQQTPQHCTQLQARFWEPSSGRAARAPFILNVPALEHALGSHGALVLAAICKEAPQCTEASIRIWDLQTGQPRGRPIFNSLGSLRLAISEDGKTLAVCALGGQSTLWDLSAGTLLGAPFECWRATFSPNGKLLATSKGEMIQIRDASNGRPLGTSFSAGPKTVNSIAFAPDTRALVSSSFVESRQGSSQAIIFWDLSNPASPERALSIRTGTTSDINDLAFTKDGHWLVSSSYNDGVFVWDVSQESWSERACRIAGRNLTHDEWKRWVGDGPYGLTCSSLPPHPSVIETARTLARAGDVDSAAAILRRARELDPAHAPDLLAELREHGVPGLVKKANDQFASGDSNAGVAAILHAKTLDPNLDPSKVLIEEGRKFAVGGNVNTAILMFRQVREWNPAIGINPETEAHKLAAPHILGLGQKLAREGRITEAVEHFRQAQQYDPKIDIYPTAWHGLCRAGIVANQAVRVRDACNGAVAAMQIESDQYLESRGIMRALTGDTVGAIADLRKSIDILVEAEPHLEKVRGGPGMIARNRELRDVRQKWVEALSRAENPFTPEVLSGLR
jgi:WD40 repeat protein